MLIPTALSTLCRGKFELSAGSQCKHHHGVPDATMLVASTFTVFNTLQLCMCNIMAKLLISQVHSFMLRKLSPFRHLLLVLFELLSFL